MYCTVDTPLCFDDLPLEVLSTIGLFCSPRSVLFSLSLINKKSSSCFRTDHFFESLCRYPLLFLFLIPFIFFFNFFLIVLFSSSVPSLKEFHLSRGSVWRVLYYCADERRRSDEEMTGQDDSKNRKESENQQRICKSK